MRKMEPAELRVAIASLGIGPEGLAKTIRVDERTIRKYLYGERSIPHPTAILIRIMVARRNWGDLISIGYGGA